MWGKKPQNNRLESISDIVSILDDISFKKNLPCSRTKYFPYMLNTVTQSTSVQAATVHMIYSHSLFLSFEDIISNTELILSTLWVTA